MEEGTLQVVSESNKRMGPLLHLIMGAIWVQGGRSTRAKYPYGGRSEGFSDNAQHNHHSDVSGVVGYRNDTLSPEMLLKHKEGKTASKGQVTSIYNILNIALASDSLSDSEFPLEKQFSQRDPPNWKIESSRLADRSSTWFSSWSPKNSSV